MAWYSTRFEGYDLAMGFYQQHETTAPKGKIMIIRVASILCAAVSAVLLFLVIAGYGTLQLEGVPSGASVRINGNMTSQTLLTLRPGNYDIGIASSTEAPFEGTVHISLFRRKVYRPEFNRRNINAIASSVLGAVPNTSQTPQFQQSQWFENNLWLAGSFNPSNIVAAFQYDSHTQKWALAFCSDDSCPRDQAKLPPDVSSYVQSLLAIVGPEKVAE